METEGMGAGGEGASGTAAVGTGTQRAPTAPKTPRDRNLHPQKLLPQFVVRSQNIPGGIYSISVLGWIRLDPSVILALGHPEGCSWCGWRPHKWHGDHACAEPSSSWPPLKPWAKFLEAATLGTGIRGNAWGCLVTASRLTRPETVPLVNENPSRCSSLRRECSRKSSRKHHKWPGKTGICQLCLCLPVSKPVLLIPKRFFFQLIGIFSSKKCPSCSTRSQQRRSPGSRSGISRHPWISACLMRQNTFQWGKGEETALEMQDLGFYPLAVSWNFPWMRHPRCSKTHPILGPPPKGAAVLGANLPRKTSPAASFPSGLPASCWDQISRLKCARYSWILHFHEFFTSLFVVFLHQ